MNAGHSQARNPWLQRRLAQRFGLAAAVAAGALCLAAAPDAEAQTDDTASAPQGPVATEQSRTSAVIDDAAITTKVKAILLGTNGLSAGDIHVTTRHHTVALTGSVPDKQQRQVAVDATKQVDGVQHVRNQLTILAK